MEKTLHECEVSVHSHAMDFVAHTLTKMGIEFSDEKLTSMYKSFLKKMNSEKPAKEKPAKEKPAKEKPAPKKRVCEEDGCEISVRTKDQTMCSKHRNPTKKASGIKSTTSGRILPDSITKRPKKVEEKTGPARKKPVFDFCDDGPLDDSQDVTTVDIE